MVMKKLTYSRKFGTKSLDHKNEVKVRWYMPGWHTFYDQCMDQVWQI